MAIKRTKKDQIDSGKKVLPKKLAFLNESGIDYSVVAHDEVSDVWSVELPLVTIRALARKSSELKDLKRTYKDVARQAALVPELQKVSAQLLTLQDAKANADSLLRKAVRRINALEKLLGIAPGAKLPSTATVTEPKQARAPKAVKQGTKKSAPSSVIAPSVSGPTDSASREATSAA